MGQRIESQELHVDAMTRGCWESQPEFLELLLMTEGRQASQQAGLRKHEKINEVCWGAV